MKSKAIFMALLALAFQVQAVPVSPDEAASAANAWVNRSVRFGKNATVGSVATHTTASDVRFYSVKMSGGGTVFVSGDTEVEPIIAFTTEEADFSDLDAEKGKPLEQQSPLWALLNRDLSVRHQAMPSAQMVQGPFAFAARRMDAARVNSKAWETLLEEAKVTATVRAVKAGGGMMVFAEAIDGSGGMPGDFDMRVPMLVKSQWGQYEVNGGPFYNYFTPNHYLTGCVATSLAQFLRYNHGPEDDGGRGLPIGPVEPLTRSCAINGKITQLTTEGGTYAWDKMTLKPASSQWANENRDSIAKLMSDCGISLHMWYGPDASGAYVFNQGRVLMEVFGYKQAVMCGEQRTTINCDDGVTMQNVMFSNFDVGSPVLVGIPGHSILADGYGYENGLPYVHLNMGWTGSKDLWYNLPDMSAAGSSYTLVEQVVYNAFPDVGSADAGGQTSAAVLSGRVLDEDGVPVADCPVTVTKHGTDEVVAELRSNEYGIWGVVVEQSGLYDAEAATEDGEWIGLVEGEEADDGILVNAPTSSYVPWEDEWSDGPQKYIYAADASSYGNAWGKDLYLQHPSVRVAGQVFSSIDRAVAKAREVAATNSGEMVCLEILDTTRLRKTQTIDFRCEIVATNDNPYASAVTRLGGAELNVVSNGFVTLRNVVFCGSENTLANVASNGTVAVAGLVDFGVSYEVAAIRTETAEGFALAGALERGFTLDCKAAQKEGEIFGIGFTASKEVFEGMTNTADRIANFYDPNGELRGRVIGGPNDYQLVWRDLPVPFEEAVGFYLDKDGGTNTAARIDKLLADYEKALAAGELGDVRKVVIRREGKLSRPLTVNDGLTLVGETNAVLTVAGSASFTVSGGTLSVTGVTFADYVGNALFLVNGDDAELDVGKDTKFLAIEGTNKWSGAVTVLKGSAKIGGGVLFDGCKATGRYAYNRNPVEAFGGAVYLAAGCALDIGDCTITNGYAANYGGAIFADSKAKVRLLGNLLIVGNTDSEGRADDIYLKNPAAVGSNASLLLGGDITGAVGVRWSQNKNGIGNAANYRLAEAEEADYAHSSKDVLFNDVNGALIAEDDGALLKWTAAPIGPQPCEADDPEASAHVLYADGGEAYYKYVNDALASLTGDATVEIIGSHGRYLKEDLSVACNVTLKSADDLYAKWRFFERRGNCSFKIVEGGSLTLVNVGIRGCAMTNGVDEAGEPVLLRTRPDDLTTVPVFDVVGGTLTLKTPSDGFVTEIASVFGATNRNAGAVSVWNGGTFAMESGAVIRDCINFNADDADGAGRGGALLVDNGVANLTGGTISNCYAFSGGGVFVGNKGEIRISGDVVIDGNFTLDGETPNNLVVHDLGKLVLAGELTGRIGYTEGTAASTEVFGRVGETFPKAKDQEASAHRFTHDADGDVGMVVANSGTNLLVWCAAVGSNSKYTDDKGVTYTLVNGEKYLVAEDPSAVEGLVYDGTEQVGVSNGVGYVVSGNVGADAGSYEATAKLRPGCAWADSSTADKVIPWMIGKADYDLEGRGVSFVDKEVMFNGKPHSIEVSGELPEGVAVSYEGNGQTKIGRYEVTAKFSYDEVNYNALTNWTAWLTIIETTDVPEPPQEFVPVEPDPVAFESIRQTAANEWTLIVTNVKAHCSYRLLSTDDLSKGFVTTGDWEQAEHDGPWTNKVTVTEGAAQFWCPDMKGGEKPAVE